MKTKRPRIESKNTQVESKDVSMDFSMDFNIDFKDIDNANLKRIQLDSKDNLYYVKNWELRKTNGKKSNLIRGFLAFNDFIIDEENKLLYIYYIDSIYVYKISNKVNFIAQLKHEGENIRLLQVGDITITYCQREIKFWTSSFELIKSETKAHYIDNIFSDDHNFYIFYPDYMEIHNISNILKDIKPDMINFYTEYKATLTNKAAIDDNKKIIVLGTLYWKVLIYNIDIKKIIKVIDLDWKISKILINNGKIYLVGQDHTIRIYDFDGNFIHKCCIRYLITAISIDEEFLFITTAIGKLEIWDARIYCRRKTIPLDNYPIYTILVDSQKRLYMSNVYSDYGNIQQCNLNTIFRKNQIYAFICGSNGKNSKSPIYKFMQHYLYDKNILKIIFSFIRKWDIC